jgi:branched-chain amino acid transport system substrate-binding protein
MRSDAHLPSKTLITRRVAMLAGVAAAAGPFVSRQALAQPAGQPIPIGVSAPLTAQFAQDGVWMKNGINLAAKAINDRGGIKGRPLRIYFEDDQGPNPTAAANAVTKLITQYNVVAMIGPHFTPAILPAESMLAQYKVPALTGASGPVVTQQNNPFVFRVRLNDESGAGLLVKYVVETLGWKKIGLSYVNTAFGQSGSNALKQALSKHGITPAVSQTHLDSTKDFTSQLLNFQQANVEGIIAWTDDQPGGLLAKQRKTLDMKFGLAGSTTFSQPPFLSLAGDAANGVYAITDFIAENDGPEIAAWTKLYKNAYGEPPELYSSTYYDAMNLLGWAMGEAATITGPDIREALTKVKDRPGVMTRYTWSPSGDMVHSGLITVIKGEHPAVASVVTA